MSRVLLVFFPPPPPLFLHICVLFRSHSGIRRCRAATEGGRPCYPRNCAATSTNLPLRAVHSHYRGKKINGSPTSNNIEEKNKAPILTQSVCASFSEPETMKKLNTKTPFLSEEEDHNKQKKWITALLFITLIIVTLLILEPPESTSRVR
ncbi:hypothetical protein L1987_14151 [Smallanthus sonchifolius]|uniref:Uncharacterized protein n=1 Tax=Smallanthus sonchifolius TaxID=185202 RepID=A0ACB9J446_9ASTR|nr:hypothetical protein L1987_14151 [Smallanthus sonchifolius]